MCKVLETGKYVQNYCHLTLLVNRQMTTASDITAIYYLSTAQSKTSEYYLSQQ